MNKNTFSDKELDSLLGAQYVHIEDNGFSAAVMNRINRRRILAAMIPAVSGFIGALISFAALPIDWVPSFLNRLALPLIEFFHIDSSELLLFMTRYGIQPSLFWIFLAVPLFILPFAIHQD